MRMPGTCAGCGQRVELRIGMRDWNRFGQGAKPGKVYRGPVVTLPPAWCDPGSHEPHVCVKVPA